MARVMRQNQIVFIYKHGISIKLVMNLCKQWDKVDITRDEYAKKWYYGANKH